MIKFLASTITAAAIFSAAIVPASAAAPKTDWQIRFDSYRTEICEWLQQNCGIPCFEIPSCPAPNPDDGMTETPDTQLPDTELPDTELPEQDRPEAEQPEVETPEQEQGGSVSELERKVVELVNAERAAYGLPALELNVQLCDGARMKSQDMASNGYFSHESPTYGSPFDMMRSLGISYRTAGENIAMGYSTAEAVVNGWMNSEGHRANILSTNYTQIGVGYVASGNYWTQWFIS